MGTAHGMSLEFVTLEGSISDSQHAFLFPFFAAPMTRHLSLSFFSYHLNKVSFHKRSLMKEFVEPALKSSIRNHIGTTYAS